MSYNFHISTFSHCYLAITLTFPNSNINLNLYIILPGAY